MILEHLVYKDKKIFLEHPELIYIHMIVVFYVQLFCVVPFDTTYLLRKEIMMLIVKIFLFSPLLFKFKNKVIINYILIKFIIKIMFIKLMNIRTHSFFLI